MDKGKIYGVYKEADGKWVKQDAPHIGNFYSMTTDNEGRVHLVCFRTIYRREQDGSWTDLVEKYALKGLGSSIRNIVFDREGNMFIMAGGVWKLTPDGQLSLYCDSNSDAFNQSEECRSAHPIGLAFDANGVLYSTGEYRKVFDKETGTKTKQLIEGHIYRHNPETGARELYAIVDVQPYFILFRTLSANSLDGGKN